MGSFSSRGAGYNTGRTSDVVRVVHNVSSSASIYYLSLERNRLLGELITMFMQIRRSRNSRVRLAIFHHLTCLIKAISKLNLVNMKGVEPQRVDV